MNNDLCIIVAVERNRLLVDIHRVPDTACSPANEDVLEHRHLPELGCDFRSTLETLAGVPKVRSGTPTCSQTFLTHFHGTPVPIIRDYSDSCTSDQIFQLLLRLAGFPS
jgi:hypothetical protein